MGATIKPASEDELVEAITDAANSGGKLELRGGGSKAAIGRPTQAAVVDMTGFSGIMDYQPRELILRVRAGTPLGAIEAALAAERQMLAFDPFDHGPLFGLPAGAATIGGVVAAGVSGSRRLSAGGARDHMLGFRAVSGRGEVFIAGGNVVKNVTGYDLPKLVTGSWGRLAALTEVTLKVLPRPEESKTLALHGLEPREAVRAMAAAMGSAAEVSAAAHLPGPDRASGRTLLRLCGVAPSIAARAALLRTVLSGFGRVEDEDDACWDSIRELRMLPLDRPLWRVSAPPRAGAELVETLEPHGALWILDWAGGLAWIAFAGAAEIVRTAAASVGGHAMLVRAPEDMRAHVAALHPASPSVAALEERVRRAFDPNGIFETGRL